MSKGYSRFLRANFFFFFFYFHIKLSIIIVTTVCTKKGLQNIETHASYLQKRMSRTRHISPQ